MKLQLQVSELKFSTSPSHVNKMTWEGVVTKIAQPSDGAPGGANGQRTVFTQECIINNYLTLNQMPLNCTFPDGWFADGTDVFTGHGDMIIGYIEDTWVNGNNLMAKGVIWKLNFPDIAFMIVNGKSALGFSIEAMVNDYHDGESDGFLYIDDMTFVGCALLWQSTAAFGSTQLTQLVAQRKDGIKLSKEELQALFAEALVQFSATVDSKIESITAGFAKINEQIEQLAMGVVEVNSIVKAQKEEVISEEVTILKSEVEQLKAEKETLEGKVVELEASKQEPERKTLQFGAVIEKFEKVQTEIDKKQPLVNQMAQILANKFPSK